MPVIFLMMWGGTDKDVQRRRREFAFVTTIFCGYLVCMTFSFYFLGFPASHKLFTMPIMVCMLLLPWAAWSYYTGRTPPA